MLRETVILLCSLSAALPGWANTYRVRNLNDSGTGSLRWAINQANNHAGRDKIHFASHLSGKVIRPLTELPSVVDHRTIIDADMNGDGTPDVAVNGGRVSSGSGLVIQGARHCTIAGLAICNMPLYGIATYDASYGTIRACHLGVNLAGTAPVRNGHGSVGSGADIYLQGGHDNTIGGTTAPDRNILSGGDLANSNVCVWIESSSDNVISGNYFGLARDGLSALGGGHTGIYMNAYYGPCANNAIGGTAAGERNVFAELAAGVIVGGTLGTAVQGNYFGLLPDGSTAAMIGYGINVVGGSVDTLIGGTDPGARNVFGVAGDAIEVQGGTTMNTVIQGNYLGLTADGTGQRRLEHGIEITDGAKETLIGGPPVAARNYISPKNPGSTSQGVRLVSVGTGTIIQNNRFGIRPDGRNGAGMSAGIQAEDSTAEIRQNAIAVAESGVFAYGSGTDLAVHGNRFRSCYQAVSLTNGGRCRLGNLGNGSSDDDGGNVFKATNTWAIYNDTTNAVKAEGNRFGTRREAAINARIFDKLDDPSKGLVDFDPLAGGVSPTSDAGALAVVGTTALSAPNGGAEIAFTLCASANVSVCIFNIAGRPVAEVARERALGSGRQTVLWSGRTSSGLAAPAGRYLVRVTARGGGQQATAVCGLALQR